MRDNLIAVVLTLAVGLVLIAAAVHGYDSRMIRITIPVQSVVPSCYEDEAIVWHDDSHSLCVPIDDIVDRGIEVAIQNGVLQFATEGEG